MIKSSLFLSCCLVLLAVSFGYPWIDENVWSDHEKVTTDREEESLFFNEGNQYKLQPPDTIEFFDDVDFANRAPDEVDDPVVVDGDILVSKEQAAIYYKEGWKGLINSQAWDPNTTRWGQTIPYEISDRITGQMKTNVEDSVQEINNKTCVKMVPKNNTHNTWISFVIGRRCLAPYGKPARGASTITLDRFCAGTEARKITPAHEVMHVMGRFHEQKRPDRDQYIVLAERIACDGQYEIEPTALTFGINYDYHSSMHYSQKQCGGIAFTIPENRDVNASTIGQRNRLSDRDIQHIKRIHCPNMMTKLTGGEGPYEGRIEINSDNVWGTVCSNGFDEKDAEIVCKYLGHPSAERMYTTGNSVQYMTNNVPIWMSNLMCNGKEHSLFDCQQTRISDHQCTHEQDVAVRCSKAARLIGDSKNSGRLEVYYNSRWGSVCSHNFGYNEAKVACRMMGYSRPLRAFTFHTTTDNNNHHIVLSDLECDGTEDHLSACNYYEYDPAECSQGSPVHLMCN